MNIALNMVTYNEAHRIYESLVQTNVWIKEFVIIDQSSTDSTQEEILRFAENYDAMVSLHTDKHWGFCEPSRKLAHANTSADWILVLDADEQISAEFVSDMYRIAEGSLLQNEFPVLGAQLKRSFWLSEEHRFTGDYQYRFFHRSAVEFLDEIHTSPQPLVPQDRIFSTPYIAILHQKTWQEQIRDELAYEQYLLEHPYENNRQVKLDLNVHLKLLRETGLNTEQIEAMTLEERKEHGVGA